MRVDHVAGDEPVPHLTVLRSDRHPTARRLQADEPALARRDADRAAAVAGVADRDQPGRDRGRGSAARPAGTARRVPRVPGRAVRVRLGGGLQPELGRVGLADDDEAGVLELVEEVRAVGRGVADLLQQLVAEVQRRAGELTVEVLHHHRHAGERAGDRRRGACAGAVEQRMDHRVDLGVGGLDARDRGVDELGGGELARGDELGLGGGVERGEVGAVRSHRLRGRVQAWTGGRRSAHGAAASSCAATRISRSSRPKAATSWTPDGQTVGGPVQGQADRGLARDVALGRERHERGRRG